MKKQPDTKIFHPVSKQRLVVRTRKMRTRQERQQIDHIEEVFTRLDTITKWALPFLSGALLVHILRSLV